jgi:hypothetical protein
MRRGACLVVGFALVGASAAGARAPDSGIAGRIVAGPTCPVQSVPPQPGCAPRPIRATLRIRRVGSAGPGASLASGVNGRFRIALHAGTYVVVALARAGSPFPRPPAASRVKVDAGRFTFVTITYDTGIR